MSRPIHSLLCHVFLAANAGWVDSKHYCPPEMTFLVGSQMCHIWNGLSFGFHCVASKDRQHSSTQ